MVYPTMPFAPTGDWGLTQPGVIDPAKKKGHMRYAGSVNLSDETFGAVAYEGDGTGVDGDQIKATLELGKMFMDAKVSFAVNPISQLIAAGK
jgi:creatinine amidohydrolase/Fe(II)-dependent formamide hydrolase-like protein